MSALRYFTGKPCKRGHIAERTVSNKTCCECSRIRNSEFQKAYPEVSRASGARWRKKNSAHVKAKYALSNRKARGQTEAPTRPMPEQCERVGCARSGVLCEDHEKTTGRFRGWLCPQCNLGIVLLGDGAVGAAGALAYLEERRVA